MEEKEGGREREGEEEEEGGEEEEEGEEGRRDGVYWQSNFNRRQRPHLGAALSHFL